MGLSACTVFANKTFFSSSNENCYNILRLVEVYDHHKNDSTFLVDKNKNMFNYSVSNMDHEMFIIGDYKTIGYESVW